MAQTISTPWSSWASSFAMPPLPTIPILRDPDRRLWNVSTDSVSRMPNTNSFSGLMTFGRAPWHKQRYLYRNFRPSAAVIWRRSASTDATLAAWRLRTMKLKNSFQHSWEKKRRIDFGPERPKRSRSEQKVDSISRPEQSFEAQWVHFPGLEIEPVFA